MFTIKVRSYSYHFLICFLLLLCILCSFSSSLIVKLCGLVILCIDHIWFFSLSHLCICYTNECYTFVCFNNRTYCLFATKCIPLSISCKSSLVVINYLNFCLFGKDYSSLIFERQLCCEPYSWLAGFFLFRTLNILSNSLVYYKVAAQKSAVSLKGDPHMWLFIFLLLLTIYYIFQNNYKRGVVRYPTLTNNKCLRQWKC
jgi:hypothetical protein